MTVSDLVADVDRGIALLDEKKPGWRDEVDVDRLSIINGFDCVLGQLYGGYYTGLKIVAPADWTDDWDVRHGFVGETLEDTLDLAAIWKQRLDREA